ncbi:hypothetical protein GCM10007859_14970 [Brevundimonas denitrificans]|uniref:DUF2059 domain-containing protein n=2 Tax=Brevundimonas denitrificans TaxID=1443434 RepID=A0ABQ6BJ40_9CAUL|nr:hypothetical protein GCM10007859_14970 [Brevundimonas denitrificans]
MTAAESDLRRRFRLRVAAPEVIVAGLRGSVMRIIAILAVIVAVSAGPVMAQTRPDAARQNHLDLAAQYLELTQGGDLVKQMRRQIEDGYGEADLPPEQRAWLVDSMSDMFADVMALTIVELRDDVADSFTVQELETAIAFYDSPIGRSVVRKQVDMNTELQEVMMGLLVPRITDLMEKYCTRFDCTALGEAAAKRED